jgi:hypothetical protein
MADDLHLVLDNLRLDDEFGDRHEAGHFLIPSLERPHRGVEPAIAFGEFEISREGFGRAP